MTTKQTTNLMHAWISVVTGMNPESLKFAYMLQGKEIHRNGRPEAIAVGPKDLLVGSTAYRDRGYDSAAYAAFRTGMEKPHRKTLPGTLQARCHSINGQAEKYFKLGQASRTRYRISA